jgi:hypothetical protein
VLLLTGTYVKKGAFWCGDGASLVLFGSEVGVRCELKGIHDRGALAVCAVGDAVPVSGAGVVVKDPLALEVHEDPVVVIFAVEVKADLDTHGSDEVDIAVGVEEIPFPFALLSLEFALVSIL